MTTPNWTLSVENFGRVRRAEIALAPLVVMVGKNNTGKSYLASLIWGLLNPHTALFPPDPPDGAAYTACGSLVERLRNDGSIVVGASEWSVLLDLINEMLRDRPQEVANDILGCSGAPLGVTGVVFGLWPDDVTVNLIVEQKVKKERGVYYRFKNNNEIEISADNSVYHDNSSEYFIIKLLVYALIRTSCSQYGVLYIPAARTGLMIAHKALVVGFFRALAFKGDDKIRINLSRPIVDFLDELNVVVPFPGPHFEIANDLEREVLHGEVQASDDDSGEFWYVPQGTNIKLPMCAASSLVTELAPFILLLKFGADYDSIIFEEPEAHLHLSAQKVLARSLVRLVNAGVQVIITTHSDTFLQQLNILMHLHQHPRCDELIKEFGYRPDEMLNPESARGYLFDETPEGTIVREMKRHREGFVEPLMNEAIANMTKEVLRLQETDDLSADEP